MEALRLSDRIGVMDQCGIRQVGSAEDVMNRPADEVVASLVGIGTIVSGQVIATAGDTFSVAVGDREIESIGQFTVGEIVGVYVRPENVALSIASFEGTNPSLRTSARNVFPGTVTGVTHMGF
jgi:ABC-type Fe3+/spermidine/putrescine transport system ATPase subunit